MIFAKETCDGHASRVEVSFRAPLSKTGVDEDVLPNVIQAVIASLLCQRDVIFLKILGQLIKTS